MTSRSAMLDSAVAYLRDRTDRVPSAAIILGSGLGGLAEQIDDPIEVPFAEIPGFAKSTAAGHRGQMVFGSLATRSVVAMAGRLHRYEGWSEDQVSFPVRVMARLGAVRLIVSNAAGGVHPKLRVGDIVVIRDHIHLQGRRFLGRSVATGIGGTLFSPARRGEIYDRAMSKAAMDAAVAGRFNAHSGTYLATLGPNYETRAEYRMMRRIGADVVGMSTIPEVLAANESGMRVLGISMVSNVANPDRAIQTNHQEVLEAGKASAVKMESIVRRALVCP